MIQQDHLEPYDVLCLQDRQQQPEPSHHNRMAPSSTPDVAMESQYLAHRLRQSGGAGGGSNRSELSSMAIYAVFFYKRQWKNSTSFASKKIRIFN